MIRVSGLSKEYRAEGKVHHVLSNVSFTVGRGEKVAVWGPSPGFRELRWIKPVLAGDTIRFASEIVSLRPSSSRPEWGILEARMSGTNQRSEPVFSMVSTAFVPRNPGI